MTPATNSKRRRPVEESTGGASTSKEKKAKLRAPCFSAPNEMVTFLIGETGSEEPFKVHKEFACYYSPVLRAAFNSSFLEGQTQTYRLEDIGVNAFRLLVQWLYSQNMDVHIESDLIRNDSVADVGASDSDGNREEDGADDEHNEDAVDSEDEGDDIPYELYEAWRDQELAFVQLWVAGDRLLIPSLQNAVMLTWHELWAKDVKRVTTTSWLSYAYQHTCAGSSLRNLAVDVFTYNVDSSYIEERADEFPREMLVDLVLAYSKAVDPILPQAGDEISPKETLLMVSAKYRYQCIRTWRSYLVPENE